MSSEELTIWQRLEIEPTGDQRTVKRAYAKQLKLINIAEDPAGFQTLREARDMALFYADYDDDLDWNPENTTDDPKDEEEDGEEEGAETVVEEPPLAISSDNSDNEDITSNIDLQDEEEPVTATPIPPNIITIDEDNLDEQGAQTQDTPPDELSYEDISDCISELISPWGRWQLSQWKSFIEKVRESAFEKFRYAEYQILIGLGEIMDSQVALTEQEQLAQRNIINYLDEEFGWRQNDRRVYDILNDEQAQGLMDYLRDDLDLLQQSNQESYFGAAGFPSLTEDDFINYLGASGTSYEKYYHRCRNDGHRFSKEWCWSGFLMPPIWLAHRCNDGIESLVGIIYMLGLTFLFAGLQNSNNVLLLLGPAIMIILHLVIALDGKCMLINTMATTLTELAADTKMTEEEKQKKLKFTGHGGLKGIWELVSGMLSIAAICYLLFVIYLAFSGF